MTNIAILKMTIEIVDLPIENCDFPELCKRLPEGKRWRFDQHKLRNEASNKK